MNPGPARSTPATSGDNLNRHEGQSRAEVEMKEGWVPMGLDAVLKTEELAQRSFRPPDFEGESRALAALARELASNPQNILQKLVETALALCRADSAGISILEPGSDPAVFRWHAIAGGFAENRSEERRGGTEGR